jgi:hypothetical protein
MFHNIFHVLLWFHKSFTCVLIISFKLDKCQKAYQSQSRKWTVDVAPVGTIAGKIVVFVTNVN